MPVVFDVGSNFSGRYFRLRVIKTTTSALAQPEKKKPCRKAEQGIAEKLVSFSKETD